MRGLGAVSRVALKRQHKMRLHTDLNENMSGSIVFCLSMSLQKDSLNFNIFTVYSSKLCDIWYWFHQISFIDVKFTAIIVVCEIEDDGSKKDFFKCLRLC